MVDCLSNLTFRRANTNVIAEKHQKQETASMYTIDKIVLTERKFATNIYCKTLT